MIHKTHLVYCFAILYFANKIDGSLVVNTNSGKLEGREVPSILQNEKYYAFAGIPYAKPPVGALRFMVSEKRHLPKHTPLKKQSLSDSVVQVLYSRDV